MLDAYTAAYLVSAVAVLLFLLYLSYEVVQSHFRLVRLLAQRNDPVVGYVDISDPSHPVIRVSRLG